MTIPLLLFYLIKYKFYYMLPTFLQELFKNQQYNPESFFLIAGPCVVESEEIVMEIADTVSTTCNN